MSSSHNHKFLAACWIVYGIARLIAAVWLATFTPIATVMFGALLTRVANPFSLMAAFHLFYLLCTILSAAAGLFGLLAGAALISGWSAARMLALIASVLSASEVPVGLTLGTYTLVALLPLTQDSPGRLRA